MSTATKVKICGDAQFRLPSWQLEYAKVQPKYAKVQPKYAKVQPKYANVQAKYAKVQPKYVKVQPKYAKVQPKYVKVQPKYANRKLTFYLAFDDKSIVCPVYYHFRDIRSRNMHDLGLDLQSRPKSNVNMLIESQHATSYLMEIVMLAKSFTVCSWNVHDLHLDV